MAPVKLPFDRNRMRERNLFDDIQEVAQALRLSPGERFLRALDLSDACLALARANPDGIEVESEPLEEKARRWTLPRLLVGSPSCACAPRTPCPI